MNRKQKKIKAAMKAVMGSRAALGVKRTVSAGKGLGTEYINATYKFDPKHPERKGSWTSRKGDFKVSFGPEEEKAPPTYTVELSVHQMKVQLVKMLVERIMDPSYDPTSDALVDMGMALGLRLTVGLKPKDAAP